MIYSTKTEIEQRLKWIDPDARLILIEISDDEPSDVNFHDASPEERARALDEIAEMNRDLPIIPNDVFRREHLYEDRI
jgi:hypothetical protein